MAQYLIFFLTKLINGSILNILSFKINKWLNNFILSYKINKWLNIKYFVLQN